MHYLQDLFAHNATIQALANAFALATGFAFLVTAFFWLKRFLTNAYHTSFKVAQYRSNFRFYRKALISSLDIHVYVSHLVRYYNLMFVGGLGLLIVGIGQGIPRDLKGNQTLVALISANSDRATADAVLNMIGAMTFSLTIVISLVRVQLLMKNVVRIRAQLRRGMRHIAFDGSQRPSRGIIRSRQG